MNSFPFFRSLQIGNTAPANCVNSGSGIANTQALCRRILDGYTCGGAAIDFTE